jgi:hypothetical protein
VRAARTRVLRTVDLGRTELGTLRTCARVRRARNNPPAFTTIIYRLSLNLDTAAVFLLPAALGVKCMVNPPQGCTCLPVPRGTFVIANTYTKFSTGTRRYLGFRSFARE